MTQKSRTKRLNSKKKTARAVTTTAPAVAAGTGDTTTTATTTTTAATYPTIVTPSTTTSPAAKARRTATETETETVGFNGCCHGYDPTIWNSRIEVYFNACEELSRLVGAKLDRMQAERKGKEIHRGCKENSSSSSSTNVMHLIRDFFRANPTLDLMYFIHAMAYKNTDRLLENLTTTPNHEKDDDDHDDDGSVDYNQIREWTLDAARLDAKIILEISLLLSLMMDSNGRRREPGDKPTHADSAPKIVAFEQQIHQLADCERHVIRFYDDRMPCSCLQPLLKTASTKERGSCALYTCAVTASTVAATGEGRSLLLCSGCQLVKYCSKECQRQHWPDHKSYCRTSQKMRKEAALQEALVHPTTTK